ncbi:MAG: DinB family protein [Bacteroidia bacterium]|nr:DinB family protein [Bacteroidia bacterium]
MRDKTDILVETIEEVRNLTLFYLSKLDGTDYFREFEVNGQALNSAAWTIAHLTWAEDFLVYRAITGKGTGVKWLDHFRIGSERPQRAEYPSLNEIINGFGEVHLKSMDVLMGMIDEDLEKTNSINLKFQKGDNIKVCLMHHIRHESSHGGHLSWLCKINGVKTV